MTMINLAITSLSPLVRRPVFTSSRALVLGALFLTSVTSQGCGGGGGGGDGDFVGAATVSLQLQPSRIDSGDRTEATVQISDVHPNGISLKFRYPDGLRYVPNSGVLFAQDREIDISPTVNSGGDDEDVYLVFYLAQSLFRESGQEYNGEAGTVSIQLEGIKAIKDASVEVDADVDDPQEDNASEFRLDNPEFAPEDEQGIEVVD